MPKKMSVKLSRKHASPKESKNWPQFKRGYLDSVEDLFRQTNPGLLEIIRAVDKGSAPATKKRKKSKRLKKAA